MISFLSTGLSYKLFKCDNIDVTTFLTPAKLDYIFKNYLFYKGSTKLDKS
jgi:hypothetical protein